MGLLSPSPIETGHFDSYKIGLRCVFPAASKFPVLQADRTAVQVEKLAYLITRLLLKLETVHTEFENEVLWSAETCSLLKGLAVFVLPIMKCLEAVPFENIRCVPNPEGRFQRYEQYFNIIEVEGMTLLQFAREDAKVLYWVTSEMSEVRVDEFELINFVTATRLRWELILAQLKTTKSNSPGAMEVPKMMDRSINDPISMDSKITTAFFRWFVSHYEFGLNIIHAKYHLDACLDHLDAGNPAAANSIEKAGLLLRGSTTSMLFGCMMPMNIYQRHIRPSMGLGFTGTDNPQWVAFAEARKKMIGRVSNFKDPIIIRALQRFFEKFLQDIEMHVFISAKLVGERSSLTVDEINNYTTEEDKISRPATADLRNLHYMRIKEFEFLKMYPILYRLFHENRY